MTSNYLPVEILLLQLTAFEVLESIYSEELKVSSTTNEVLPQLRRWAEGEELDDGMMAPLGAKELEGTLQLRIHAEEWAEKVEDEDRSYPLSLSFSLPLYPGSDPQLQPLPILTMHQPAWLSRADHSVLSTSLTVATSSDDSTGADLVMLAVDHLRENAGKYVPKEVVAKAVGIQSEELYRFWLWFPSLSTREKREDIVNWAADFNLTGFVLAGKPALLCLEGTSKNVETYMSDIKSRSWADIPSFQKKVTERYRSRIETRKFDSMSEITSIIGQGGARGNRGEMGELREYLAGHGLEADFGNAIGGGSFQ